jgi:hypothetical protein
MAPQVHFKKKSSNREALTDVLEIADSLGQRYAVLLSQKKGKEKISR